MLKRWTLLICSASLAMTPAYGRSLLLHDHTVKSVSPGQAGGAVAQWSDPSVASDGPPTGIVADKGLAVAPTQAFQWPTLRLKQYGNYHLRFGKGRDWGCEGENCSVPQVDPMTPTHLRLGGAQEYDSVPLAEHCYPYGADWQGTCVGVGLGSQNMAGEAPGIGPGAASQIGSYDHFDAAALTLRTVGATPIFTATSAGQDATSPYDDGADHSPAFTSSGAGFANPLPFPISQWLLERGSGMRVVTNETGCATSRCVFPNFVGIVSSYAKDGMGRITGFSLHDGWQIFGSGSHGGLIPGKSSVDGSAPGLDTVWSSYVTPAVMFGGYTKSVGLYASVEGPAPAPHAAAGDVNNPTGEKNSQLRLAEFSEVDLWGRDPLNGRSAVNGLTINYHKPGGDGKAHDYLPALDAFNFASEGATSIAYKMGGEYWTVPFTSPSFYAGDFGGAEASAGSEAVLGEFAQRTTRGYGYPGQWDRLTFWNHRNVATGDYRDMTTSLGVQIAGATGGADRDRKVDGVLQEHIELNPRSNHNGFAFCGYQQTDAGCNVVFDGSGNAIVRHTIAARTVAASQQLVVPFGAPTGSHAPCAPGEMKMDQRYFYSCVAPNTWHRASNGETW
ncbi:hypothetical protein [Acetobacter conturbans]|uniref:Uncharacterized protein n=1 Tax=Acetobacter conturbans TaxID=1737472 RepID=A0ABX0K1Y1_9PROT|nr:hypothetical protein [Acetobacter conturbans]NHN89746.1 hypothetical protein [Acetobacter conturbans]